jgi:flagellar biosynthesis/type III secretory pathway chaperone
MKPEMRIFLSCLDDEIRIYQEILLLVEEEKKILVKNEELSLEEVAKKQDRLIKKISEAEEERKKLLKKLTEKERKSASVEDRIKKIKALISRIGVINNTNIFLIKQGRDNVRAFLDLILEKSNLKSYSSDGKISNKPKGNIFINKTV